MGGGGHGILPSGYEQLNYVYSNGDAFISTLYKPVGGEQITVDTMIDSFPNHDNFIQFFGVRYGAVATSENNYWLGVHSSGMLYTRFGTVNPSQSTRLIGTGVRRLFYVDLVNKSISLNGTERQTFPTSNIKGNTDVVFVFRVHSQEILGWEGTGLKIYEFIIKKDGIELCHLIPAKRISDNYIGMYDIVADVFRINSGNGSFVGG